MKRFVLLLIAVVLAFVAGPVALNGSGGVLGRYIADRLQTASRPSIGLKPLTEMSAADDHSGEHGGLYGGGQNDPPVSHLMAAKAAGAKITPLNVAGKPVSDGAIGFVSISRSNATMEFSLFKELADRDDRKSPRVVIVDCAQGGQAMAQWVDPDARAWIEADRRLAAATLGGKQVQVAWIKLANVRPTGDLADHGPKLYDDTLAVLQNANRRFPNLQIAYLGSRIYGGYAPEPEDVIRICRALNDAGAIPAHRRLCRHRARRRPIHQRHRPARRRRAGQHPTGSGVLPFSRTTRPDVGENDVRDHVVVRVADE